MYSVASIEAAPFHLLFLFLHLKVSSCRLWWT
nr:MAG TPA: hypothetical protein [Caudoviricetes sp.]